MQFLISLNVLKYLVQLVLVISGEYRSHDTAKPDVVSFLDFKRRLLALQSNYVYNVVPQAGRRPLLHSLGVVRNWLLIQIERYVCMFVSFHCMGCLGYDCIKSCFAEYKVHKKYSVFPIKMFHSTFLRLVFLCLQMQTRSCISSKVWMRSKNTPN